MPDHTSSGLSKTSYWWSGLLLCEWRRMTLGITNITSGDLRHDEWFPRTCPYCVRAPLCCVNYENISIQSLYYAEVIKAIEGRKMTFAYWQITYLNCLLFRSIAITLNHKPRPCDDKQGAELVMSLNIQHRTTKQWSSRKKNNKCLSLFIWVNL